jgi:hypothetical protein
MISNKTINPLIIRNSVDGPKLNNDLFVGVGCDGSSCFIEGKYVVGVCEELELGLQLGIV